MEHSPVEQAAPTPPRIAAGLPEVFVVVVFVILTALLLGPWDESGTMYVPDFLAQMLSPWLLPALGLLWVIRCGGVDLSVWVGLALGSAATAAITHAGGHPLLALAVAAGAGLALGAVNAAGAAWARLPAWGVTGITATVGVSVARAITADLPRRLDANLLGPWSGVIGSILLTGGLYAAGVLTALLVGRRRHARSARPALAAALLGSGVLSALGGLCLIAKLHQVPRSVLPVDDLRVLAAVVLTGAVVLRGPGRGLLSAVLLPPAMLLATIWRQRVWDVPAYSFAVNLIILSAMALGGQSAAVFAVHALKDRLRQRAAVAMLFGVIVLAVTGRDLPRVAESILRAFGSGLWLGGAGVLLVRWLQQRRRARLAGL